MTLRTAKISMLFGVALFYAIGAFRNLTDYNIRPSAPRSPRSRYSLLMSLIAFVRRRWPMVCDVAIEILERSASRLLHVHRDRRADLATLWQDVFAAAGPPWC
jgi:hypothetical protein